MGGAVIGQCREQHREALNLLIKMASLQTMFKTLDEEIKMTSRRVNALECVVIPKLSDMMQWIKGEMDEMEREEFYRVKKVVEKKRAREDAAKKAALAEGITPEMIAASARKQESAVGNSPDADILF